MVEMSVTCFFLIGVSGVTFVEGLNRVFLDGIFVFGVSHVWKKNPFSKKKGGGQGNTSTTQQPPLLP